MPSIFFRFEVEPICIRFVQQRTAFSHFIVQLCAIVGGAVAVLGLVNSALKSAMTSIKPAAVAAAAKGKAAGFDR